MGAITGKDFIDRLNQRKTEIWFNGKKVEGKVSEHLAFKGLIHTKASLYDLQHDPKLKEDMTFIKKKKNNDGILGQIYAWDDGKKS